MKALTTISPGVKQYLIVTGNYWAFTLTDGALRMLVVLHFHHLGYTPLAIAMLFVFYELFGVATNLVGGWLGARIGLNRTMNLGLMLQVFALAMLAFAGPQWLTVAWVMAAQALSGIAKDLNKMSAKSAIKSLVVEDEAGSKLYRWVALLTGSKNTLKGVGFFMGGVLLTFLGFSGAAAVMMVGLILIWLFSVLTLQQDLGKAKHKPKFREMLSKSRAVNVLSAARLFLFGARDVWFVVALPVFLAAQLQWDHYQIGGFLALWVIGYGMIQTVAPKITGQIRQPNRTASRWAMLLAFAPMLIAMLLMAQLSDNELVDNAHAITVTVVVGLMVFGALFAVNSSLHSFLIVRYADADGVSKDVGFYYMANAAGRLIGTVLSGWMFQQWGLITCLWTSALFVVVAACCSLLLPVFNEKNT